jgi:hypothetical protein
MFYAECTYAECYLCRESFMLCVANKPITLNVFMLNVDMLSVVMLSVVMLSVVLLSVTNKPVMLNVFMLNVDMLSVVMLNVVAPKGRYDLMKNLDFFKFKKKKVCCSRNDNMGFA